MVHIITNMVNSSYTNTRPGVISVCNVDKECKTPLSVWIESRQNLVIGAMGTRAKQRASQENLALEFTYGVIDKCILRALRGLDSLILTPGSMVNRIFDRVDAYCSESGNEIAVIPMNNSNHNPEPGLIVEGNKESLIN